MKESMQRVLFLIMLAQDGWLESNRRILYPEVASSPALRVLYTILLDFFDKYGTTCTYEVLVELIEEKSDKHVNDVMEELNQCLNSDINDGTVQYVQEVLKKHVSLIRFQSGLSQAVSAVASGDPDRVREILDETMVLSDVREDHKGLSYFDDEYIYNRASITSSHIKTVPTLIKSLDEQIGGGGCSKNLLVLLAPPSRGKSMGLVNVGASAIISGYNVLHVTVEMSKERVARRYDARFTGMTFKDMDKHPKKVAESLKRFKDVCSGRLHIAEWPSRTVTVKEIESYMLDTARRYNFIPDILVLDYADELKRPRSDAMTYAIGEIFAELRSISMKHEIPVWTATQTTRDALDKTTLDMNDVADSWDKMKIADYVIAMCQTQQEEQNGKMRYLVVKARDEERTRKPIHLKTDFSRAMITEAM